MAAGQRVEETASLPSLALPAAGWADEATLQAIESLDPVAVVLSDRSALNGEQALLSGAGRFPVVRISSAVSGGGPGPDPRNSPVQIRQRFLADTWVRAVESKDGITASQLRLVTAANQVQDKDPGITAPWIRRATLSDLLSGTPAPWNGELAYPREASEAELTAGQLASLRRLATSWSTYAELLVDPGAVKATGQAAAARAASTAWRNQERHRRPFLTSQQDVLDATLHDRLRISTTSKVSTTAQDGVVFPITVKNDLPVDPDNPDAGNVQLQLVFVSDNPQRLRIAPIDLGELRDGRRALRAGENYTATASVTAKANGTVPVQARLQTLDGTPVGRPQQIDVRVTQNGTTGWAIAAAALVVFGGSTVLRIRQVRSNMTSAPATNPVLSGLTSAPPASPSHTGAAANSARNDPPTQP